MSSSDIVTTTTRFRGRAEVFALPQAYWSELERLSYEADPDTQMRLNALLDRRGVLISRTTARNLVTTAGLNYAGTTKFPNGSWFIGQKGAGAASAADTMASHAPWVELIAYTQGNRPALTLGAWSGGVASNSASPAVFTAPTGGLTFNGFLLVNNSSKGGTGGTLYSVADHGSPQAIAATAALRQTLTATEA